jgi:hypothetical protein
MKGITMKNLFILVAAVALASFSIVTFAGEFGDLRTEMSAARESLIALMLHADQRGANEQKKVKDTADAVSAHLAKLKAPAGKETQFKELVDTWKAFKETREKELVPAILKGNDAKAKEIAGGIQKERITKCQLLIGELGD